MKYGLNCQRLFGLDRDEFIGSTIVVLFLVAVFAIYLGVLDACFL